MKQTLRRHDIAADEFLLWNRFVAFLARSNPELLEPAQRPSFLAFWYDSEVQNGGHLQFFLNRPGHPMLETVLALETLGAKEHAEVLLQALKLSPPASPTTGEEFVAMALEDEFERLDKTFYSIVPTVTDLLESHLDTNIADFFMVVD